MLLVCVVLSLLLCVQAAPSYREKRDLTASGLTDLYNTPVKNAELMQRHKNRFPDWFPNWRVFTHSGVRVTLDDGHDTQYLIHKGPGYGKASDTVVTDAAHMSDRWQNVRSRDFDGSRTVGDFVAAGGENYGLSWPCGTHCHTAAKDMMEQK